MHVQHRWLCLTLLAAAIPASAQAPADRNYHGAAAGLSVTRVSVAFGDEDPSAKMGVGFDIGYRAEQLCFFNLPVICWQRYDALKPLRLTFHVAFMATDLRGMDPERDTYSYSHLDFGVRATYALANEWRPYLTARMGSRTTEQLGAPNEVWNRVGSGSAFGAGLEIPVSPSGRGLDVGVTFLGGRFTEYEFMKTVTPSELSHRAVSFYVGWTGPFTGISLPWQ